MCLQGELLLSSSLTNRKLVYCVWQEEEFNWLLKEEVHAVLKQLQDVLKVNMSFTQGALCWSHQVFARLLVTTSG